MAYQTKMLLRLAAPAVAVFVMGLVAASSVDAISSLSMVFGGSPASPDSGNTVALGTGVIAFVISAFQIIRYWRWTRGEGDICYVCTCLLGREREGRYGPYRNCLGCGKNHSTSRI